MVRLGSTEEKRKVPRILMKSCFEKLPLTKQQINKKSIIRGPQIFQNSKNKLKISDARKLTL